MLKSNRIARMGCLDHTNAGGLWPVCVLGEQRARGAILSAFVLSAFACSSSSASSGSGSVCPAAQLMVAASDEISSSKLDLLNLDGAAQVYVDSAFGSDPALTSSHGRTFWIDRSVGNVVELDPRCGTALTPRPWSTSDPASGSTDPQDIAVAPDGTLWIARFNVPTLLIKSSDGATSLRTIDLSGVAGENRNPDMSSIRIIGDKAYVALEMLNADSQSVEPSYLVRLDVTTRAIDKTLQLKGRNPFGLIVEDDAAGALFLAAPGSFDLVDETDAGIERVDLASFTSELIVRESDIGASVDEVSVSGGCGVAIVAGKSPTNPTSLIAFDPVTGAITAPLAKAVLQTDGFKLGGLAWPEASVVAVGDGTVDAERGFPIHLLQASDSCGLTEKSASLFAPLPPIALLPIAD